MIPREDVFSENSAVNKLVHTPIVEFDKYIQCVNYLNRAKRELHDALVYLNESIKLPDLINVLKALIAKIDEKIRMSSRQDIDQSILFVASQIKSIKNNISHEKGENSSDVPVHLQAQQSVLKGLVKDGRELLKIIGNPKIDLINIPKCDKNAVFSSVSDNYDYESEMVKQQKALVGNTSFKQFLNQIWVQSIQDGLPSKRILISYAWPLQDDKYKNEKGEFIEVKEKWVQEFLQNLANFLIKSGIVVYLDKNNSGGGFVLSEFMKKKINKADHCLIISTRTLGYKMGLDNSGVIYEYQHMKQRMEKEPRLLANRFIIPILLNNNFYGPQELSEIGEILFCYRGFLYGYESLIKSLYRYGDSIDLMFLKYRNYLEQIANTKQAQAELPINKDQARRSQLNFHLFNFQPRNRNFVGRVEELKKLEEHIKGQQKSYLTEITLSVVVASGGMGKSLLVNQFAYQNQDKYELVCLIPAETVQQIEASYTELASDLEISCNKENLIKELRKWWRAHARCLIIFDNAKSYDQIENYLPLEGCDVVITSRSNDWPAGTVIKIDAFSHEDARNYIELILDKRPIDKSDKIKKLMVHTDCFPLRLAHACAYIKKHDMDIDDYISLDVSHKAQLYSNALLPSGDHHSSVYTTYSTSMIAIERANPLAATILKCCAYLYSDQIPGFIFDMFCYVRELKTSQNEIQSALNLLVNYSMVEMVNVYDQHKVFRIHRVVQEVIRFNLIKTHKHEHFIKFIYALLGQNLPYGYEKDSRDNFLQKKLLAKHIEAFLLIIEDLPEIKAMRQDEISFNAILRDKGEQSLYEIDINFMQDMRNVNIHNEALLPPGVRQNNDQTSRVHRENRRHSAQCKHGHHNRRVYSENKSQQASDPNSSSHCKMALALSTHPEIVQYRFNRANITSTTEVARVHRTQLDLSSLHLYVLSFLSDIYFATLNVSRQKIILQRIIFIKKLRYERLKTVDNLNEIRKAFSNLAGVYERSWDFEKEKMLHEKALMICETIYDNNHPELAMMLLNFACALSHLHEFDAQALYLLRAKEILEKHPSHGQDHPDLARIIMSLGLNCIMKGNVHEGQGLMQRAHDAHTRQSNKITPQYITMLNNLSVLHENLGLYQQQCDLLERGLDLLKQYYREINLATARQYVLLARAKFNLKNFNKAKDFYKYANEIFIKEGMINNEERATLLANYASVFGILEQLKEQESHLNEALQIFIKNNNTKNIDVARIYLDFADLELRNTQQNKQLIKERCCYALDILLVQNFQIKKNILLMTRLGNIFIKIGEHTLAQKCFSKLVGLVPDTKLTHADLGCKYHIAGDEEQAEQHFKLAIKQGSSFSVLCEFSLLLMQQKRFAEIIDYLSPCIQNENDKSGLFYDQLQLAMHDNYLKQEIKNCILKNEIYRIQGVYFAHYLLFRALQFAGNRQAECEKILNNFQRLVDKNPTPESLRLISFIYKDLKRFEQEQNCLSKANELLKNQHNAGASNTSHSPLRIEKSEKEDDLNAQRQCKPGM